VSSLQLRAWQGRFAQTLKQHRGENFLLVACPAAGKTIAAGAALAAVMDERDLDQLIVISPTVVVRDQWQRVLASLGYRMRTRFPAEGWPAHIHGVCANYHQVVQRINSYAAACQQRRTAVIFDEIHHAGAQRSWGAALNEAFEAAQLRLLLSGTPFRSDQDRIPFVRYQNDGSCIADFHYEYAQAVRDGVCRPIEFRAHDGLICWQDKHGQQTARLSEPVGNARAARLRASLDPRQPYLQSLLQAGEEDLCVLREEVPDAGGLIICDSQAHALEVERLIGELTGRNAVLAISDRPGAHQAILDFARSERRWLISVRMVSEGVDIPRLGVIVWASTATTELMVRQVAGRALRGRGDYARLPAIVHMPADPELVRYARRLEAAATALSSASRTRGQSATPAAAAREIPPGPLLRWIERETASIGEPAVLAKLGWQTQQAASTLAAWRQRHTRVNTLTLAGLCERAGIAFDEVFASPYYQAARRLAQRSRQEQGSYGAINAQPISDAEPLILAPALHSSPCVPVGEHREVSVPVLPPSPRQLEEQAQARQADRGDLFTQIRLYGELRREIDPAYQLASAQRELLAAVGAIDANSSDEQVQQALDWIKTAVANLARAHPEKVKDLARARRRLTLAATAN
jgi:superfamily II DNA or RNA helicase